MDITLIPAQWITQGLVVKDSVESDLPELDQILTACAYIEEWSGWRYQHPDQGSEKSMRPMLIDGEIPPNGSQQFFRLQSIRSGESGPIIGFLTIYHGFPEADIVWILYLYIHPDFQGKGNGRAIIQGLGDLMQRLGYTRMRLVVDLKNWPAIRFWTKEGFNRIVEMDGDKILSDTTFAQFILEKSLSKERIE